MIRIRLSHQYRIVAPKIRVFTIAANASES